MPLFTFCTTGNTRTGGNMESEPQDAPMVIETDEPVSTMAPSLSQQNLQIELPEEGAHDDLEPEIIEIATIDQELEAINAEQQALPVEMGPLVGATIAESEEEEAVETAPLPVVDFTAEMAPATKEPVTVVPAAIEATPAPEESDDVVVAEEEEVEVEVEAEGEKKEEKEPVRQVMPPQPVATVPMVAAVTMSPSEELASVRASHSQACDTIAELRQRVEMQARVISATDGGIAHQHSMASLRRGTIGAKVMSVEELESEVLHRDQRLKQKDDEIALLKIKMEQLNREHHMNMAALISQVEEQQVASAHLSQTLVSIAPSLVRDASPIRTETEVHPTGPSMLGQSSMDARDSPVGGSVSPQPQPSMMKTPFVAVAKAPEMTIETEQLDCAAPPAAAPVAHSPVMMSPGQQGKPSRPGRKGTRGRTSLREQH
ncbi:hypothetical protein KIPB_000707 [Kipferlia bialata]|uniref:Uncharacterized protein n=1 Tax=Kipferlia bialata TaxID=797122 RepID=A0A9K3CPM6_9EUKA|nr:hypothetical protein KIPB_000707 [Kipferlia bialata]|eukprot:g707.t1